jgi:hypothetical protein
MTGDGNEKEVETAFGKEIKSETEQKQRRTVLFPIRLDDAVMDWSISDNAEADSI